MVRREGDISDRVEQKQPRSVHLPQGIEWNQPVRIAIACARN